MIIKHFFYLSRVLLRSSLTVYTYKFFFQIHVSQYAWVDEEEKEFRVIFREDNMALFWLYMRYFRLTRSSFLSVLCFDRATGERENMKKKFPSCSIVVALWQASWALCYGGEEEGMKSLILGCHHSVWWTRIRSSHHTRLHNSIV